MSIIGSLRVAMRRMDGWINQYTGVGGSKRTAHTVNRTARLAEEVIEELYASDGLAARAIDAVPKDAMRGGLIVKTGNPEVDTAVRGILKGELELPADVLAEFAPAPTLENIPLRTGTEG